MRQALRKGSEMAKLKTVAAFLIAGAGLLISSHMAQAAPCLDVVLTGTSGPPPYKGLAGPGTLVTYGDDANQCRSVILQFDVGRGTLMRMSQLDIEAAQVNAVFFTHMHSDHMEGFSDLVQMYWIFGGPQRRKLDVVCTNDAKTELGVDLSCRKFVTHINDAYEQSGETAYRKAEMKGLLDPAGPVGRLNLTTFDPKEQAQLVWSSGDVKVSAIGTTHIPGSAAFRVDTPAGSVAIGGDSSNSVIAPPRKTSTSDELEKIAQGADVIVNTTIHPVLSPESGAATPPAVYYRQSNATDLGAMAKRAGVKVLMLTHLAPPIGATMQGTVKIQGGALSEKDYEKAARDGGFTGQIIVGTDLARVRLPQK
jgi:ribonuclease Z